jgi:glycosyltransferase involved in cell wall biosynthesis
MGVVATQQPNAPLVSVGMPAYNSARTIASALDCILNQTFRDLELIVSDNCSTDGTWAIIEEYSRRDPRVVGIRQTENIGANGNYSAVFRAARGRYFKWASSNDWCAPEFLERCVGHLESHVDTVLVAPRTRLFENSIASFVEYERDHAFEQEDRVDRFTHINRQLALNNVLNGLVRSDALRRTKLIEHWPGADIVLIAHLALLGKIALLEDRLFYRRMERETATRLMNAEAVHLHHYPRATARSLFGGWRFVGGFANAALSAGLSARECCRALVWTLKIAYWNNRALRHDVVAALRYTAARAFGTTEPGSQQ